MYMLNSAEYTEEKIYKALEILYTDRKNEFRELSRVVVGEKKLKEKGYDVFFLTEFAGD